MRLIRVLGSDLVEQAARNTVEGDVVAPVLHCTHFLTVGRAMPAGRNVHVIRSGYPSGVAAFDHSRKYRLRSSSVAVRNESSSA